MPTSIQSSTPPALAGFRTRFGALVCLALELGQPSTALADLDKSLAMEVGPAVVKYLRANDYHKVGVLKFRVQRGKEDASFAVGPINDNMVTRLENAILYAASKDDKVMLLEDPSTAAAKQGKRFSYLTAAGREQLLALSYPLAWGDEKQTAKADVLLTGLIELKPKDRKALLTIEAFGQKSKDLTRVHGCEVPLDRTILSEAGMGFTLTQEQLVSLGPNGLNDAASADAAANRQGLGDLPLKWSILYNGDAQESTAGGTSGQYTVAEPMQGQKLAIRLTHLLEEKDDEQYQLNNRLGIVVLVNGKSSWNGEENLPITAYKKWYLYPGKTNDYEGCYSEKETRGETNFECAEFKVLSDAATRRLMDQEELHRSEIGTIVIHVFRKGSDRVAVDDESRFSLGLRAKPTQRRTSFEDASAEIRGRIGKIEKLGAAAPDAANPKKAGDIEKVDGFKNPQLAATIVIRYYRPNTKKIER